MSVLFLSISNLQLKKQIGAYFSQEISSEESNLRKEILQNSEEISSKIKAEDGVSKRNFLFKKFKDKIIDVYYLVTSNGFLYVAYIELYAYYVDNFKEESIFELFEDIDTQGIKKLVNKEGELTKVGEQNLKFSIEKYQNTYLTGHNQSSVSLINDESNSTKIDKINAQISEATNDMKKNVENMMNNVSEMSEIEGKSVSIRNASEQFMQSSKNLERKMRCDSLKNRFVIGFVVVIVLIIFGYLLI